MRILYFGYPTEQYGAPHQEMAAVYLARKNHVVNYICWGGESAAGWSLDGVDISYMPQPKKGLLSAFQLIAKLVGLVVFSSNKYDVIYVQGAQQTPFVFWLPLFKRGKRIVYHTQDYLEPRRHRFYERFERWLSLHADYVICNEQNRARFMKSYYGLQYMPAVIRTALPEWWTIPDRGTEMRKEVLKQAGSEEFEDATVIIAGGTYRPDRMSPRLLEAFSLLPDNYIIVFNGLDMKEGGGCRGDCDRKKEELKIGSRVVSLGALSFSKLLSLYSAGELGILLYPNDGIGHYYQCPGRFSEYLRCGLSLVSSNFMGLELLTLKYNLGAVCESESAASISEAILEASENAKMNRQHIITTAENEFVYETEAAVLDEIIAGTYQHPKPSVHT